MDKYEEIISKLENNGVDFDDGMSPQEMVEIEKYYDLSFPIELKYLYRNKLPVSDGFYNWRDMSSKNTSLIRVALELPINNLILDLKNEDFWCDSWGLRPIDEKKHNIYLWSVIIKLPS